MQIGNYTISSTSPVFIIAELSANHNGSLDTAIETIRAAKRAGADAIKFQTYTADTITIDSKKNDFLIKGTIWEGRNLHSLYSEAFTPWEWPTQIFALHRCDIGGSGRQDGLEPLQPLHVGPEPVG